MCSLSAEDGLHTSSSHRNGDHVENRRLLPDRSPTRSLGSSSKWMTFPDCFPRLATGLYEDRPVGLLGGSMYVDSRKCFTKRDVWSRWFWVLRPSTFYEEARARGEYTALHRTKHRSRALASDLHPRMWRQGVCILRTWHPSPLGIAAL